MLSEVIAKLEQGTATQQEIFDEVWQWFVVKKNKKSAADGGCLYRKNRRRDCKTRCGAGLLISDNRYTARMEERSFDLICEEYLPEYEPHMAFIRALQGCHDETSDTEFHKEVKHNLFLAAGHYRLTIPSHKEGSK